MSTESSSSATPDSLKIFFNRELSWLNFAERVIALVEDTSLPLLERIKFAGIAGTLHDEFFMKRMSGMKRQMEKKSRKLSFGGLRPEEEFSACRKKLLKQVERLATVVEEDLRPALTREGFPIFNYRELNAEQKEHLREYFQRSVLRILTPLTVDSEHPFPFISNQGLNLGVMLPDESGKKERFVRIKVPNNRPRWVPLTGHAGFVPLEQVIAANLDMLYPQSPPQTIHLFRVTRGAEGEVEANVTLDGDESLERPGSIIDQVSNELKARRFAGVVRLQVESEAPRKFRTWLTRQLKIGADDLYASRTLLGLSDLIDLPAKGREDLRFPKHVPVTHKRLRKLRPENPQGIFEEIERGDILLHHPYHDFDTSVVRLLESASVDPAVLGIKLTIYRTSGDSSIVRALTEAARRGKQVAVLVEVTARFDEAPNIAWGRHLENEGVHVAYGVERLKTHVKLALIVREVGEEIRSYVHVGTGNYHSGTAKLYEDLGILTADPTICSEVAAVFNGLTGATPYTAFQRMLVAPVSLRKRLIELIRREAENARAGLLSGIDAKMNQLQDPDIIRELYSAAQSGVPIRLNVRGLCCLRPGVEGLS